MESLTARVLRFQRTGEQREAVIQDVACRVYEYPRRKCRWDEEAASEFFARVFPKIQGMIERFKDVGRPFESYLASTLCFQVRTFVQDRRRRELEWEVGPSLDPRSAEPHEDSGADDGASVVPFLPVPSPGCEPWEDLSHEVREVFGVGEDGTIRSSGAQRRFLVACFKSAHLLADADISAIARITGRSVEALHTGVQRLRARSQERSRRLELFTERRNRAYASLRLADARLAREIDPERRRELERTRARLKETLRSCGRIISRIRLAPSHRQIGEVLGMPKASVDSTIYRLKRRAARVYAPRHAEYA